ncbi:hypothetical protein LPB73_09810 [Tardiphaga sp. 37S4]|uniref:hypothetical protein n=1 Tax=Tardiphaga sp. 37S4 TaxID=1404741 RepID=UPI001E29695B|nr:hypothetical protein [Tardiphaga sp. 37S4]UFS77645.1 hypothetical protein LPB73_09810 [Tardiphaga sp. 37S4]
MKALKFLSFVAVLALLPAVSRADPAKKERKPHYRVEEPRPIVGPLNDTRGNAALGGNNANSAFGDNSAGSNANGRTSGGAGGMN